MYKLYVYTGNCATQSLIQIFSSSNMTIANNHHHICFVYDLNGLSVHTMLLKKNLFESFAREQFEHPLYSPNVASSDYHFFRPLNSLSASKDSILTKKWKWQLIRSFLHRRRHSTRKDYKNLSGATTNVYTDMGII